MERSAQLLPKARTIRTVLAFYDISRAGMHRAELKKRQVWPNCDSMRPRCNFTGKVTGAPDLQSARVRISLENNKIIVLF